MPKLNNDKSYIFDPVLPFKKIKMKITGVDTWHDISLIKSKFVEKLKNVVTIGSKAIVLSSGVEITLPLVEIGIQIGNIMIEKLRVFVVDDKGFYDLLLGSDVIELIFDQNKKSGNSCSNFISNTEGNDALIIEYFPTDYPYPVSNLEKIIKNERIIYNVVLIALKRISVEGLTSKDIESLIENDKGIPDELKLKIDSVEEGSVLVSFSSGCKKTLKYIGKLFKLGASARLACELAEKEKLQIDVDILKSTRDAVAKSIVTEKENLAADNIHKTYELFRKEQIAKVDFLNELINATEDESVKEILKSKKDKAILEIAEQNMVSITRHMPESLQIIDQGVQALPSPDK